MNRTEFLQQLADQYRSEGYDVSMALEETLPPGLSNLSDHVDLIARKNGESVAIEVKRRDQLYQLNPPEAARIEAHPGWRYDLAVYPPDGVDDIPLEDGEPSPEYIESLLAEAQRTLELDQYRASFLVAWSAVETAMRTAARREDLDIEQGEPRFVLSTLYSNGPMSYEDYERLRLCLNKRDRLVHGLPVDRLEPGEIEFLIECARHLLCEAPEPADA